LSTWSPTNKVAVTNQIVSKYDGSSGSAFKEIKKKKSGFFNRLPLCHNVGYEKAPIFQNIVFSQNCVNKNAPTIDFAGKIITK
jgi:hypothetical protein